MPDKIQMKSIHLVLATGLTVNCGKEAVLDTWEAATAKLKEWDHVGAGLQGIDYVVTFEDGFEHSGLIQTGGSGENGNHSAFNEYVAAAVHRMMRWEKGSFIDRTGENREKAIVVGAKYDYACSTEEEPLADKNLLRPFMHENEGTDAGISVAGKDDTPVLIFADGDHLLTSTTREAEYLLRQWRIMNNIHPFLGGDVPLIEEPTATAYTM